MVSRAEFDMLRAQVAENRRQLEAAQLTAGALGGFGIQLTEVVKDVSEARHDLAAFRTEHLAHHDADAAARTAARRWAVGAGIAAVGSLWAPLIYLIAHLRG